MPEIPCESGKHGKRGFIHPGRGVHDRFGPVKKVRRIHNKCGLQHSLIEDQAELQLFIAMREQRLPVDEPGLRPGTGSRDNARAEERRKDEE